VLCMALLKGAARYEDGRWRALPIINIWKDAVRNDYYKGLWWHAKLCTLFAAVSSQARRGGHDALEKWARRLRSISLHGSAPARHLTCTIG
jgi:hypothetical protein